MLVVQVLLVYFQSNIPRGSDQFWYIVDSESVAENNFTTNNVFPNSRKDDGDSLRPFVQNRPIVYLAGYLVKMGLSPVEAYKIINVFSYFLIIILLFFSLRNYKTSVNSSIIAISVFVSSPLIIFSIYNPLTNLFDASLFSAFVFSLFILFERKLKALGFSLCAITGAISFSLLILQRSDFLMYLWGTLGVFSYMGLKMRSKSIRQVLFLIAFFIFVHYINVAGNYFPSHLAGDVPTHSIFLTGVDGYFHNMIAFFGRNSDFNHLNISEIVIEKVIVFFKSLFEPLNFLALWNLFVIFAVLVYKRLVKQKIESMEVLFGVLVLFNLAVLIGFQFQYRYSVFLIAPSVYIVFNNYSIFQHYHINRYLMPIVLILFVTVNYFVFRIVAKESNESYIFDTQVKDFNIASNSKAAVVYNGGSSLIWSWLLKDISEVHYFLPNEMRNLTIGEFDLEVHCDSIYRFDCDEHDERRIYKVGEYYVQLSKKEEFQN